MGDGNIGGAAPAPPCPLCNGTGQRRIRRPGTPRRATVLVDCRCVLHQARRQADAATTTLRSELDRLPAEFAVAQFARLPAPQSVTGLRATEAARHLALLRQHGWLVPAANTGGRTLYRAAIGTPFGVQPARSRP